MKNNNLKRGLLLLIITILAILFYPLPIGPKNVHYRSVFDNASQIPSEYTDVLYSNKLEGNPNKEYIIKDDSLYLKIMEFQSTRSLILAMYATPKDWDINRIRDFREKHPELEVYWPKPKELNAGVAWIK